MKQLFSLLSLSVSVMSTLFAQTELDLINAVNLDSLSQTLQEFTGEVATSVGGNSVTILNRGQANNELAGDYLVEKFNAMDNLSVNTQAFNTNGRNIIATQLGKTNPTIFILFVPITIRWQTTVLMTMLLGQRPS